ncbi:hypothetical protein [Streptomyces sp. BA2]|uniref:hypothetical protein n=1 Tax=Streptomyces sp. BA2 TaxID=436595 RepID=UPI001327513D|nr:hypothetical protein [Streptomyces sp. BA2]MWA08836.1 hypothetical protein [Streptomyces sp. BA2]
MTTVISTLTDADGVEESLVALDADYTAVYGPELRTWSRGVRGEYFSTCITRRSRQSEAVPLRPRRSSAGRRRRHCKQLPYRIDQIAPGAVTVLATPVWTDTSGEMTQTFVVRASNADGDMVRLPQGGCRRLAALLQGAFPAADWERTQTWHADTGRLTTWGRHASRAFRDSADAGFVESLAAYDARLAAKEA